MVATVIGVILGFLLLSWVLHLLLAVYQTFFGFDGRAPWNNNRRLTTDQEMERWWEIDY